jgi:hypothetical protein
MIEEHFSKAGLPLWPKQPQAKSSKGANITMLRYPLLTQKKWEIIDMAAKQGLDIAGWYASPVHPLHGDDLAKVGYQERTCLNAENLISKLIHLPTGTALNKRRLEAMMKIICKIMRGDL